MKNNRKEVERRHTKILSMLQDKGSVNANELARYFKISLMTVRRDLQHLEDKGLLFRTHGGAVPATAKHEIMSKDREVAYCREKISEYAASFVEDGDTIFINGSSTALNIIKYLGDKHVVVYTNNCLVVNIKFPPNVTVNLTGGEVRDHVMIGEYVVRNLFSISADKTFLGCAAVYENGEFRYDIPTEIGINEAMIGRTTGDMFILADHTKVQARANTESLYGSCIYDRTFTMLTDSKANELIIDRLRKKNIQVTTVEV